MKGVSSLNKKYSYDIMMLTKPHAFVNVFLLNADTKGIKIILHFLHHNSYFFSNMLCCTSDLLLVRDKVFVLIGVITAFYKYHQRLDPDCCCLITVKGQDAIRLRTVTRV